MLNPEQMFLSQKLAKRMRLQSAVGHLLNTGKLNRADIMRLGEVSIFQAALDFGVIRNEYPGLMIYDAHRKTYVLNEGGGQ